MARYTFRMDPTILGLSVLSLSPGVTGLGGKTGVTEDDRNRALVETALIGAIGVKLTHSYWPLAAPALYLGFNYVWAGMHNVPSQVGT